MKMWREVEKEISEQSLWIERKKFCVSPFPGRSIRVVEMLKYRRYSVEFKSYEVPWFIEALREAGQVTFGAPFSKNATIGRRSMFLSIESNRAGVFIKMVCSFGGRNRRLLLIPAGEKGEGWLNLANLLAIISSGGEHGVKKSVAPSSNHRSGVKRKESLKEKIVVAEEWKEGFLPVFLKHGLELCVGAPFSSDEASRFFAWKRMQSELGCGLLVVEKTLRSGSPSNLTLACMDVFSGGEGFAGEDEEKEPRFLQAIDVDGVSICGKSAFEFQKHINDTDAPVSYPFGFLGGGPIPSAVLAQVSNEVSRACCSDVFRERTVKRAPGINCKSPIPVKADKRADNQAYDYRCGFVKRTVNRVSFEDGSGLVDRVECGSSLGPILKPRGGGFPFGRPKASIWPGFEPGQPFRPHPVEES